MLIFLIIFIVIVIMLTRDYFCFNEKDGDDEEERKCIHTGDW